MSKQEYTSEQIKQALKHCAAADCHGCPLKKWFCSETVVMEHAATTINQLQAENMDLREECKANYLAQADKAREVEDEAVKEFAEMVKEETLAIVFSPDVVSAADYIKCIDKLVEKWLVRNND